METLSTKYRPKDFQEVLGEEYIKKILTQQLIKEDIKNSYLFVGPSGCGKTSLARILAKKLNGSQVTAAGEEVIPGLYELDAASNSGVDNVRQIIESAQMRALDAKYKIFIIDECHSLSSAAWQAFLKMLEEPPTFSIFIFCTTNGEKIPQTIQNRVMRFNLSKISTKEITGRLNEICEKEGFTNYQESCEYIAQLSEGSVRTAISYLEKVSDYSKEIRIENVIEVLGTSSYDSLFDLTDALINDKEKVFLDIIDQLDKSGKDSKIFLNQYIDFLFEILKFIWSKDISMTYIPNQYKAELSNISLFQGNITVFNLILTSLLELKNIIKTDENPIQTVKLYFIKIDEDLGKIYQGVQSGI